MKILLIESIPRKTGHTYKLAQHFKDGLISSGADFKTIDLFNYNIKPCKGCYICWSKTPGKCVIHDDMEVLMESFLESDIIFLITPMYHYTMNCEMLKFLERTLPFSKYGFNSSPLGLMRNSIRYPEKWKNKKLGLLTCGAFKEYDNFSAITRTFELIANGMNLDTCGILIRPESYLLRFKPAKPKTITNIEKAFERAGYELGTNGSIRKETIDNAKAPIVKTTEMYISYARIYWEYVKEAYDQGINDENIIAARVTKDPVILMRELNSYINPVSTARVIATLYFHFTDRNLKFTININKGKSELITDKEPDKYDLKVETDSKTWGDLFLGDINPREALISKKIILKGDKHLFLNLEKYFPPPSD